MEINQLPLETLVELLINTDGCTLARCREVCKKWKEIIDNTDFIWQQFCEKEFYYPSRIAKKKAGHDLQWYHIYKNLKMWSRVDNVEKNLRDFYRFTDHDKFHALEIEYNVLPLKNVSGYSLYEISTLTYIPVVIPAGNCLKISNNDHATVILTTSGLMLERTVQKREYVSEAFFKADNCILAKDNLYYFKDRDIYQCNLLAVELKTTHVHHCDYDIKEIQVDDENIYLFTDCGKIVKIHTNSKRVSVNPIYIPIEWIKQIKHVQALDDKNFVCYSRNLFKIETSKYQHLYLDFPPITALFFYGDVVIIGTRNGEILLYRLSSQKRAIKPIFENLAHLPDEKFAVHLDVCEKKSGPVIVIATFFEIMLLEINFFPNETSCKRSFPQNKFYMYKRLLKIKERLENNET